MLHKHNLLFSVFALAILNKVYMKRYLAEFFLKRRLCQIKLSDKIKTHILRSITLPENRSVYETMWKNMVGPEGPHMTT
jgi:hypothetical protein